MSSAAGAGETDAFATLLRELKDRSGLSYGALAKRLHLSTSTLHRYCNGTALPNDYAPVERLARACRATPRELVELHRRWILADAARATRSAPAAPHERSTDVPADDPTHDEADDTADDRAGEPADGPAADRPHAPTRSAVPTGPDSTTSPTTSAGPGTPPDSPAPSEPSEPVVERLLPGPLSPRRRRTALIASATAAVLLAATTFLTHPWTGTGHDSRDQQAGATSPSTAADAEPPSATPSPTGQRHSPSASASATGTGTGTTGAPSAGPGRNAALPPTGSTGNAAPLTVGTRPYVYDSPCSQHFLVDSAPAQVGPPANEQDAPRWAAAYGAVSSDEQRVALTVQGTGAETVVLEALHVRALTKDAPLAWNDYSMGVGCGGGVDSKSFDIDLDDGSPTVTVKNGQRDFPYKVSESDPEVFYVTAHTKAHDVRWDLSLDWSSGNRHGTVRIDDDGLPFRTSADVDRPGYDYPLGGSDWITRDN
ncbi:putative DNA-binding protein [Actinacidiphila reveromycinica]|uniref:Putative DNA-binding protein n=1 Tax=Actinacidiphila reveromycinica TaxID=659352 RepID=A0A7U3UX66_9ACTN|nr:helix-turn-helix transcriptional regulator [Streptomyces sp. SN-593]BBB00312.1 putative DNA-binding protein [Streptomyces sp. SN-593]